MTKMAAGKIGRGRHGSLSVRRKDTAPDAKTTRGKRVFCGCPADRDMTNNFAMNGVGRKEGTGRRRGGPLVQTKATHCALLQTHRKKTVCRRVRRKKTARDTGDDKKRAKKTHTERERECMNERVRAIDRCKYKRRREP